MMRHHDTTEEDTMFRDDAKSDGYDILLYSVETEEEMNNYAKRYTRNNYILFKWGENENNQISLYVPLIKRIIHGIDVRTCKKMPFPHKGPLMIRNCNNSALYVEILSKQNTFRCLPLSASVLEMELIAEKFKKNLTLLLKEGYAFSFRRLEERLIIEYKNLTGIAHASQSKLEKLIQLFESAIARIGIEERQYETRVEYTQNTMTFTVIANPIKKEDSPSDILDNMAELLEAASYPDYPDTGGVSYFVNKHSQVRSTLFAVISNDKEEEDYSPDVAITCRLQ